MKILLITNYWQPWNNAGTFRWWNFAKYIDLDVLTVKKTKGILDETLEFRGSKVYRIRNFSNFACVNGLLLTIAAIFTKADVYVFTTPPETLIIGAWILQKIGKKVILDVRDKIDRPHQKLKILNKVYYWFYKRIINVVVAWKMIDENKTCIHHGHDNLKLKIKEPIKMPRGRFTHKEYNELLERGFVIDYSEHENWDSGYVTSSYINHKILWNKKDELVHEELNSKFFDWETQAKSMKEYILKNNT